MRALAAALLSSLGAFLFGLDIGYIAPILSSDAFQKDIGGPISDSMEGFIVGVFSLGCVCTAFPLVSGYFLDSWGRRDSIIIGSAVFLVGCWLQGTAASIYQFLLGRFVAGLSIGLLSTVVALYQSEVSPPAMRGALTSLYQLMITSGILAAAVLDDALLGQESGWRYAILLQLVPAFLILAGMPFLPRSPRWLMLKRQPDRALKSLRQLRTSDEDVAREFKEISANFAGEQASRPPAWSELFNGLPLRLLLLGASLQMLQQLVGMNAIMYFGPRMFEQLGLDRNRMQVYVTVMNFCATFAAVIFADGLGRRFLLAAGAVGMLLPCVILSTVGSLYLQNGQVPPAGSSLPTVMSSMIFLFVASFAMSWGPMVWVYTAEMYPLRYRAWLMGLSTTSNWVGNYVIGQLTPILLGRISFLTFGIFGVFSFLALLAALWLPETSGLPLEHIDQLFEQKFQLKAAADEHGATVDHTPLLSGVKA